MAVRGKRPKLTARQQVERFRVAADLFNAGGKGTYVGKKHKSATGKVVTLVRLRPDGGLKVDHQGDVFPCAPKSVRPV